MEPAVFFCQKCKCRILISASENDVPLSAGSANPSRLEESFMVLEEALYNERGGDHHGAQRLEESFIMLSEQAAGGTQATAASLYPGSASVPDVRLPLYGKLQTLKAVLEIASQGTAVDHPVCMDCAEDVRRELDAQLAEVQAELAAYDAALARTGTPVASAESERDAAAAQARRAAEISAAEAEVQAQRAELTAAEAEAAAAEAEVAALEAATEELAASEAAYWHDRNAFQRRLAAHVAERDLLQVHIGRSKATLRALGQTNVVRDAFRIWFRGVFGTINGLRLGTTSQHPVPWSEINAAWGSAVTLLDVLVRLSGARLEQGTLIPGGSYPRVCNAQGREFPLFGPVSRLNLHSGYDTAQVAFITLLKEYAAWLAPRVNVTYSEPGHSWEIPWLIAEDYIGDQCIRFSVSYGKRWTKALKYMLVDLQYCQKATQRLLKSRPGGQTPDGRAPRLPEPPRDRPGPVASGAVAAVGRRVDAAG